jgi:hypothetical protein
MTEGYTGYCRERHIPQLISPAQDQFVVRVEQPSGEQAERHGRQSDGVRAIDDAGILARGFARKRGQWPLEHSLC